MTGFNDAPRALAGENPAEPAALKPKTYKAVTVGSAIELGAGTTFFESSIDGRQAAFIKAAEQQALSILEEARYKARQLELDRQNYLETVARECDALKQDALKQIEDWKEEGRQQGYQVGYEAGQAQAREATAEEVATLLHYAQQMNEAAFEAKQQVLQQFKPDALAIMSHVLNRVIGLQLDAEAAPFVEALLEKAIASLHLTGTVKVVLHPKLYSELKAYHHSIGSALEAMKRFTFERDADLPIDKLFVLGPEGLLDVSPSTQVERLLEAVAPHLPENPDLT
jgi:flagellar assembly protein FliH